MNTITLPTSELKSALHGVGKIIARKTTLPVLGHVRISKQDGKVTLQATDLDAFATYTLTESQPGKSLDVLIPYDQLSKAFKCSKKEDLAILCDGKNTKLRYFIAGNPIEQPITSPELSEWPPVPSITVETAKVDPGFNSALMEAFQCCSTDPTRYVLNGACLDARESKAHYIVGTNGRFLYSANTFHFGFKEDVIIPNSKFIIGSELLDTECSIAIQPGKKKDEPKHICLQNERWQFITRAIDGLYPNWKQVLPAVNGDWTKILLQATTLSQLLQVVPNLPGNDREHKEIRLCLDRVLRVEGKNKDDADWTTVAIGEVDLTGKPQSICVNRDYLLSALRFGLNELAVLDDLSPMIARKDGKQMVIMPVRPPEVSTTSASSPASPAPTPEPSKSTDSSPPSTSPQPQPTTERKKRMGRPRKIQTPPTPGTETQPAQNGSALKVAIEQVDKIRESFKSMLQGFTDVNNALKLAEKEKKATEKEVETVRASVRRIQNVTI